MVNRDGRLVGASSSLGFAREAVAAERIAFALLMHENHPTAVATAPDSADAAAMAAAAAAWLPASGGKHFPSVGLTVHRTSRGLVSFSTKNKLCAQMAPSSIDHMADPYVTTPHPRNLVGHFAVDGRPTDFRVHSQSVQLNHTQMAIVSVDLLVNGGQLRQQIGWISVEPGIVIYMDRVTAVGDSVTVTSAQHLPLSIQNDDLTGGERILSSSSGTVHAQSGSGSVVQLAGPWISVDQRLGVILPNGTRVRYRCARGSFNRPGAAEDFLSAESSTPFPHTFTRGQLVAQRTAIVMLNPPPGELAQMAAHAFFSRQEHFMQVRMPHFTAIMDNNGTVQVKWKQHS